MMFSHPGFYCVVAESGGQILGSNCLDERSAIAGVGPITIDPEVQNKGVGRALMEAVLARSAERGFQGTRLLQAAFHNRSLSLYTKLGFDTREPISAMQGPAIKVATPGYSVRPARMSDLEECNRLCRRVHGHDRSGELRDAIEQGTAVVAERDGRIVAYATLIGFFGHTVGETNADVQALIANADAFRGAGHSCPDAKCGSVPMVPGEWPARGAADDPDDCRLLQGARRGLSSFDTLLIRERLKRLPELPSFD